MARVCWRETARASGMSEFRLGRFGACDTESDFMFDAKPMNA